MTNLDQSSVSDLATIFSFDEDDDTLMDLVSAGIVKVVPSIFPAKINLSKKEKTTVDPEAENKKTDCKKLPSATENDENIFSKVEMSVFDVRSLDDDQFDQIIDLIDLNLGVYYQTRLGKDWKDEKRDEMEESGLVYILYSILSADNSKLNKLVAFISVKLVAELTAKVLYLYEIHIDPAFQSLGIGSTLISGFHDLAAKLNDSGDDKNNVSSPYFDNEGTGLTVFSDNDRALNWYFKLGYNFTLDSPRDKVLRNKKVVKPSYYLLTRPLSNYKA